MVNQILEPIFEGLKICGSFFETTLKAFSFYDKLNTLNENIIASIFNVPVVFTSIILTIPVGLATVRKLINKFFND